MAEQAIKSLEGTKVIGQKKFPVRADYEQYFAQKGVKDPGDIWNNEDLVAEIQTHWHQKGQNGCVFAQRAAARSGEIGWRNKVVPNTLDDILDVPTLDHVDRIIDEGIQSNETEVLSFLFPHITDPVELVYLLRALSSETRNIYLGNEVDMGKLMGVGLRVNIPSGQNPESWLVGFGPFDFLPQTRQAPVTELSIRTKPKPPDLFHRLNDNQLEAHLADVDLNLPDPAMENYWKATQRLTRQILGGDVARKETKLASAKYTFGVPKDLWVDSKI